MTDDRGWVAPVAGDGVGLMDPIEPTQRTVRSSVVGGIVLLAVVAAAVAGAIWWRGRNGDPFASARSVPADMDFVVTFDALTLSDSQRLQDFVDAFAMPMVDAGMIEDYPEDLVAAIDEAVAEETNFSLSGDILSWIGRSVSLAAKVPELDPMTFETPNPSFLVSADVRDRVAAEDFVVKVLNEMAQNDLETTATTIGGLPGYTWTEEYDDITFGLVLTDEALLVGTEQDVADAIAAHDAGLSVVDGAAFKPTMDRLPADRMVSFYMAPSALDGMLEMSAGLAGLPADATQEDLFDALGASVTLVDEGVRLNYVMTGDQSTETGFLPDRDVLAGLPDDTLGFVSVAGSNADGDVVTDEALNSIGDMIDELSYQTGIDMEALLKSLSGDMTFAAVPTREGMVAAQTDVPVGVVGALGLLDAGPVNELQGMIEEMLADPGLDVASSDGITTVSADGTQVVSYYVGSDLVVVGTGREVVAGVISGDGGVLEAPLYVELDDLVIGDGLVGYADIASIVDLIPMTPEEQAVFAPLRGVGYGGLVSDDALEMEVLVLVDY